MNAPGYIYAIESGDAVKIGFARDPVRRLSELNVGTSSKLRLLGFIVGGKFAEKLLHEEFAPLRIRGEWFRNEGAVAHFVLNLPKREPATQPRQSRPACTPCVALQRFLLDKATTPTQFAKAIGATQQAVSLWMQGRRMPRAKFMRRIFEETNGSVTANDFLPDVVASILTPPRRPAPVHGPQCRHDQSHGEPRDNHYGHIPLNAPGGAA